MRRFVLMPFILILSSCGGNGEGSGNYIPSVQVECSGVAVTDCNQNAKTVYVGLIESLALDCDDTLNGLSESQRQQLFVVTGRATSTRSGIYLMALISQWKNSSGGSQSVLNPGSYHVCAFVDSNGNGQLDTNEPVGQGVLTTGAGTYILDTWTAAFN